MFMLNHPQKADDQILVQGPLDAVSISANRHFGDEIVAMDHDCITLDMRDVHFIDASGLGFLSFLFKRLSENGRALKLSNMQAQPYAFLEDLGVADVFDMEHGQKLDQNWSDMTHANPANA